MSAATLLLLVTMVLSSTPAVPAASMVRLGDDRSVPVGASVEESGRGERSPRLRQRTQQQNPPASVAASMVRSCGIEQSRTDFTVLATAWLWSRHAHVRVELLSLPPPMIA